MANSQVRTKNRRKQREQKEYFFDYSLLFIVIFLLGFGLLMIYSASSYTALEEYDDAGHYLKRQLLAIVIGLIGMTVVANIDYHFWAKFYVIGYLVSAAAILVVLTPLGIESHNARRWFKIPGIGLQVQPAEIAKLCMILFLAVMVCKMGKGVSTWRGFIIMMAIPLPIALEIYIVTSNLSSALIVMAISFLMVFVASRDYKKFILMVSLGIAAVAALVVYVESNYDPSNSSSFRLGRISAWLHPETQAQDTGYQTIQGLYAIASGGIWGKGLGQSMQKLKYLPESQNDMIFSIICEELGLFGAIAVILMFILLIWRMMVIANNATDLFGGMLVVGVIAHIGVQALMNIAVVTNTMPNTGVSLPFISYGGSSVMFLLIEMGLVFSVAKHIQLKNN